jgi:hypothetical protein
MNKVAVPIWKQDFLHLKIICGLLRRRGTKSGTDYNFDDPEAKAPNF